MHSPIEEINLWPTPLGEARPRTRRIPIYAVVLHKDTINRCEYVITVLRAVFHYGVAKAFLLTMRAHFSGRCAVWTGMLEVAELKAEQVEARGPDPEQIRARPLRVTVEPLP
jgi:ATP-dependent Clp protease adaptor protein ClpS